MATLLWSDVIEVSAEDAEQSILLHLEDTDLPATSWQEGAIAPLFVGISAQFRSEASAVSVFLKTAFISSAAQGEALTRLSRSQYLNERIAASPSTRRVTLTCLATEGPHNIDIGESIIQDATGNSWRNIEGLSVAYPVTLTSGGTVTLLYECEVPGAQSNVADQAVSIIVTTLAGVTITDDTLEEEGVDEEKDPRLQARNDSKWALLTRFSTTDDGVLALGLLASPNITVVAVDNLNPRGVGTWDVYIAGELATASSADVNDMQAYLSAYVMNGSSLARAYAAPPAALDIAGTVYYASGASAELLEVALDDALEEFLKTIPLGGFDFSPGPDHVVQLNDIETVIKNTEVAGVKYVRTVVLTTPAADFAVASYGKVTRGTWNLTLTPTAG